MRLWPFGKQEKRDVKFSPQLSAYLANAGAGMLSDSGAPVTTETALRFAAVWACIRVISEDVASLPLFLYRRQERGKERIPQHPLYNVLHAQPNPEQTSLEWREMLQTQLLLWGNAYCEIVRRDGWPAQLWPIVPSRVSIRRNSETQELEYYILASSGRNVVLSRRQMLHIRGLTLDGVRGLSPITVGREAIGLGLASQTFASGFFARGARPSAVLQHPGQLSAEAHGRLRSEFEALHTGLSNAQRVAILEEGMTLNATFQMPLQDAQFIENRKMSIEEIARLYRVQPHKIGVPGASMTYASVEQANIDHVVSTVRPWVVRWEQSILTQLIPEEERDDIFAEFALQGVLRGDAEGRSKFYKTLWEIGVFSPNDIRDLEGLNPVEDGDTYYVPMNFGPVGAAASPEGAGEVPAATQAEPEAAPSPGRNGRSHAAVR